QSVRSGEPRAELERRPLVSLAAEEYEYWSLRFEPQIAAWDERDIARKRGRRELERAAGDEQLRTELGRQPEEVGGRILRGEARDARFDALVEQSAAQFLERRRALAQFARLLRDVDEDELPSFAAQGCHELAQPGADAEDRSAGRPCTRQFELRVVAENRALELLQRRTRLDSQLVDEQPSRVAIRLECVRLPADA